MLARRVFGGEETWKIVRNTARWRKSSAKSAPCDISYFFSWIGGFWNEVAQIAGIEGTFFAWPGLGDEPADTQTNILDDLATMVLAHITSPVDIVAQPMGGVVAIKVALAMPNMVRRLVLAVASGGLPMEKYGGSCWRADYFATYPLAASWIADPVEDLSLRIPSIQAPTFLLWGDADPISPIAVGERLQKLLPNAHRRVRVTTSPKPTLRR